MSSMPPFAGTEDALTKRIIGVFYEVYNELGIGFLESVYSRSMAIALEHSGLRAASEVAVPVSFRQQLVGSFRADLLVEDRVILDLKTAEDVSAPHVAQLTHYLRATRFEVGLVLNFGPQPRFRRVEFLNHRKKCLSVPVFIPS